MNQLYSHCSISRQGHAQALKAELAYEAKIPLIEGLIQQTRELHPGMGLRKMYEKTRPEGFGRDAFIAYGMQLGYRLRTVRNGARTTYSVRAAKFPNLLKEKRFTDVNQVWTTDITYFNLQGTFVYISLVMDVYSRRILGYTLAKDLRAIHSLNALKMACKTRGIKSFDNTLIHHSDRGSQYLSNAYIKLLNQYKIRLSTCQSVYENTHIERLNGTIKNQYLKRWKIESFSQLAKKLKKAIQAYNQDRPHDSLKGMNPIQFEHNIKSIDMKQRTALKIYTSEFTDRTWINPLQLVLNF